VSKKKEGRRGKSKKEGTIHAVRGNSNGNNFERDAKELAGETVLKQKRGKEIKDRINSC